ncbi:HAAS signaling domain-containing protein [Georgenia faecalis]|uniref:DUF1700 domain-containing protein n=1 Tax=Georgenia faecalis TaxID=2483799 RepID=A0ABV9D7E5_9MICO|nr:hypothetical protein [Georgenia faecalis]
MTSSTVQRIETYLDDLARMLTGLDPVLRADVLGGVREHVDAALAGRGAATDADVDAVLAELGPPEAVAAAALEGGRSSSGSAVPAAATVRVPVLDRPWVPPTVGVLLLVMAGLYLLVLGAVAVLLPAATEVSAGGDAQGGEYAVLLPATYDLLWSVVAPVPVVGPLWLVGVVLLTASSLWSRREKWLGALLLPAVVVVDVVGIWVGGVLGGRAGTAAVLAVAWGAAAVLTAGVVTRLWRGGARRAAGPARR